MNKIIRHFIGTSFYQGIRKYIPAKTRKLYLLKDLKNHEHIGHFCNSEETKELLETAIDKGYIQKEIPVISFNGIAPNNANNVYDLKSKIPDNLNIVYCWSNDDHNSIDLLYSKIPDVVIDDNILLLEDTKPKQHKYRGLIYQLGDESHIPLHRANDAYIKEIKNLINKDTVLMEMCAGQGSIGFSLLNETNFVKKLYSVELNPNEVKQMGLTIKHNQLPESRIQLICSDALNSFPKDVKVDLVVANTPHEDRPAKTITDYQGADSGWKFHKTFLRQITEHLNDNGIVTLLENANMSKPELINSFLPANLVLYDVKYLSNTPWYIVYLKFK